MSDTKNQQINSDEHGENQSLVDLEINGTTANKSVSNTSKYMPVGDDELKKDTELPFDPCDDPMHVDFNEDQWLSCWPWLYDIKIKLCCKEKVAIFGWCSLTGATMCSAFLGIGIGLAIALAPPQTEWITTTNTRTLNITEPFDNITNINVTEMKIVNGEMVYYYTETYDDQIEVPYTHLVPYAKAVVEFPGKLWISALKLLVLPLITMMMIVLPSRVDNVGPIGKIAIPLYLLTSTCAAIQGTIWAWVIQPGNLGKANTDFIGATSDTGKELLITDAIFSVLYNAVPPNIVTAMSDLMVLGIIVFFLCLGIILRNPNVPDKERNTVLDASSAVLRCCMMAIVWVVWFTPIGMLSLICLKIAGTADLVHLLSALGFYIMCVAVGHLIHTFGFYALLYWLTTRLNPYKFYAQIFPAPLLAFATSSSAATLPRSLQVAESAGIRKEVYSFILPLGAAINMDGTALGFPIMVGLIAQLNGVQLDVGKIIVVMILAVIISIGTAPIPNVGMVYLTMLFEAAGIGEYAGEGIATLFVLDWLVDRIETAVNVTSDQYVAKICDEIDARNAKIGKDNCCGWCCGFNDAKKQIDGYSRPEKQTEMM